MGTRSKTTIFDERHQPLVSIYRQFDGYFSGHGQELADFLKEFAIVNGYGSHTPAKAANGMGCLAAQIIAHFKDGIGGIYVCNHTDEQEYNYEVRFVPTDTRNNRVSLTGNGDGDKQFQLYGDEILSSNILRRVSFVYDKQDGSRPKWRTVDVTDENDEHINGIEGGKFKHFLVSRIIDGKVIPA